MADGTPRQIGPIADEVLVWLAAERGATSEAVAANLVTEDALRRIELCALAAREASMFFDFYGIDAPYIYEKEIC